MTSSTKLSPSKSEFLWCTTLRHRRLLDNNTFALGDRPTEVRPARHHCNLGVHFVSRMTMTVHESHLFKAVSINCVALKPSAN